MFIYSFFPSSLVQGSASTLPLEVLGCHPGYILDTAGNCACDTSNSDILRCDDNNRYLYLRVSTLAAICQGVA